MKIKIGIKHYVLNLKSLSQKKRVSACQGKKTHQWQLLGNVHTRIPECVKKDYFDTKPMHYSHTRLKVWVKSYKICPYFAYTRILTKVKLKISVAELYKESTNTGNTSTALLDEFD